MNRDTLDPNSTSRDWLNQSLKVEPGFSSSATTTTTTRRVVCGASGGGGGSSGSSSSSSAYFTSTTAHFESTDPTSDYAAFAALPRLAGGTPGPHPSFPCHHHPFGPPQPPPPPPPQIPNPPNLTDCTGTLTRAHAMHSLFETYTFETGTTRQHTSVRMDHHIIPQVPVATKTSERCRKESESSTEEGGEKTAGGGSGSGEMETSGSGVVSRASYMCRKCKAHGQAVPVKRHKRACPYLQCWCLKCRLVDQGRKVVARQIALYRDQKGHGNGSGGGQGAGSSSRLSRDDSSRPRLPGLRSNPLLQLQLPRELRIDEGNGLPPLMGAAGKVVIGGRTVAGPHCRRCRNHNVAVTWKGHKKSCPYRNCLCDPCRLINVRKDTEKTLRDMAGIEEKSVLPPALLNEEVPSTISTGIPASGTMGNFFPYLVPSNTITNTTTTTTPNSNNGHSNNNSNPTPVPNAPTPSTNHSTDVPEPSTNHGDQAGWNDPTLSHRPPRRTRSLQDLNSQLQPTEGQLPDSSTNQNGAIQQQQQQQQHKQDMEISRAPTTTNTTSSAANNNANPSFDQCHNRGGNYDMYYDDKAARPVLPFWQSFSHFEEKSTVPGQGYIGGYYGLENGRVFHGSGQGHHMYSPERVSAVAAAAAAAAAMVAMTPPISGNYQQPCYPPQGRSGGLCHPLPPQHSEHPGYASSDEFNSPGGYQNRFPIERGRPEEYCGGMGGNQGNLGGNNGGWGAYRYPYMMRGLPFHPGESMEPDFAFPGPQRHGKSIAPGAPSTGGVDESIYSRPVAHVWRSQLHHLSISQLRTEGLHPVEDQEVKTFQQVRSEAKMTPSDDPKRNDDDQESAVQSTNQGMPQLGGGTNDGQQTAGFHDEYASSNGSQPQPTQQPSQSEVIFETDQGSSEETAAYRQFESAVANGTAFPIDDTHAGFSAVGAET